MATNIMILKGKAQNRLIETLMDGLISGVCNSYITYNMPCNSYVKKQNDLQFLCLKLTNQLKCTNVYYTDHLTDWRRNRAWRDLLAELAGKRGACPQIFRSVLKLEERCQALILPSGKLKLGCIISCVSILL
jgi:hypothetical protein